MGTRGFTGLVIDGVEKIGYQQYDSYPDSVGISVLEDLRILTKSKDTLLVLARSLKVVNEGTAPTPEEVNLLIELSDTGVSTGSTQEWYVLLRKTQGNFRAILDCGFVEDHSKFPLDSLFCEWGYLVDLDAGTFEVYEGFQREPHQAGRWASQLADDQTHREDKYYPVALVGSWSLEDLPTNDQFLAALIKE